MTQSFNPSPFPDDLVSRMCGLYGCAPAEPCIPEQEKTVDVEHTQLTSGRVLDCKAKVTYKPPFRNDVGDYDEGYILSVEPTEATDENNEPVEVTDDEREQLTELARDKFECELLCMTPVSYWEVD